MTAQCQGVLYPNERILLAYLVGKAWFHSFVECSYTKSKIRQPWQVQQYFFRKHCQNLHDNKNGRGGGGETQAAHTCVGKQFEHQHTLIYLVLYVATGHGFSQQCKLEAQNINIESSKPSFEGFSKPDILWTASGHKYNNEIKSKGALFQRIELNFKHDAVYLALTHTHF